MQVPVAEVRAPWADPTPNPALAPAQTLTQTLTLTPGARGAGCGGRNDRWAWLIQLRPDFLAFCLGAVTAPSLAGLFSGLFYTTERLL